MAQAGNAQLSRDSSAPVEDLILYYTKGKDDPKHVSHETAHVAHRFAPALS